MELLDPRFASIAFDADLPVDERVISRLMAILFAADEILAILRCSESRRMSTVVLKEDVLDTYAIADNLLRRLTM